MHRLRTCVGLLVAAVTLPGCFGLRYTGGVRITPSDDHPFKPELTMGVHPASWFPQYSHREFDAGAGLAATSDDLGAYAEATGVATQRRGLDGISALKNEPASMLDRTSAGGALRWWAADGLRPGVEALASNELSGFSRQMHPDGGVWGEIAIGLYAGVTISGKGKWTLSTGVQAHAPIVGIDKM